jgi:cbb3-type cytochrome c oxidase subunit III
MPPMNRAIGLVTLALAGALVLTGCDLHANADKDKGKALFAQKCGSCHTLKEAGTNGTVGPNLDAAFVQGRADGMDSDTFEGIVNRQIRFPDQGGEMPANLVKGQEVKDVAAYVASVAGVRGIKANPIVAGGGPGAQLFSGQGCSSCHTLKAAGSSATIGPNLDQVLKGKDAGFIQKSIVDPNAEIATGFGKGVMPQDYGKKLKPAELKQLVAFILKSVRGGK